MLIIVFVILELCSLDIACYIKFDSLLINRYWFFQLPITNYQLPAHATI
ncbi:hypothetical protein FDUTEX481_07524 [Tolypothrix sp. PCC 7601]|nr:hypothetical protein FDUTEX481_07524 [Tolypothrix sp. PCC 7601]